MELAPKTSTPSASSSGYGSQAVSSTNLTSEDSMSLRSISIDETPDMEVRTALANELQPVTEIISDISNIQSEDRSYENENSILEQSNNEDELAINGMSNSNINTEVSEKVECDPPNENASIVKTNLSPGKVVRRVKKSNKNQSTFNTQRASFPQVRPYLSESKVGFLESLHISREDGLNNSTDKIEGK